MASSIKERAIAFLRMDVCILVSIYFVGLNVMVIDCKQFQYQQDQMRHLTSWLIFQSCQEFSLCP